MPSRQALVVERCSVNWRKVRQDMEHERYQHLRKCRHEQLMFDDTSDDDMRQSAFEYASESCRDAIARWNEAHGTIV